MGFWDLFLPHPNQAQFQNASPSAQPVMGGGVAGRMLNKALEPLPAYGDFYNSKGGILGGLMHKALGSGVDDQSSGLAQAYAKKQASQQALQALVRMHNPATGQVHLIPPDQVDAATQAGGMSV